MAVADDINGQHYLVFATLLRSCALVCFHRVSTPSIHVYAFWASVSMYICMERRQAIGVPVWFHGLDNYGNLQPVFLTYQLLCR